ncbi:putative coil containing protein [Vibrio phage 137E35-1]|nr:putative coil containing protein [Vibrio phage 137E35-1]CAH9015780.1 putative coil containing protein [Vibrio phage 230E39-1]
MNNEKVINPEINADSQYIAIYHASEAALIALEEMTKDAVVDLTTKQGIEDCKEAANKFMKVRTGIEKLRKDETKEQREYVAKVNDQAKAITARILPLENKFKAPLNERKDAFKAKIAEIDAMPSLHENSNSEAISVAIGELEAIVPSDFAEFQKDCKASLFTANDKLTEMLSKAIAKEEEDRKAEEERQRQEEERERQAELIAANEKREAIQKRITNLQQIPLSLMGKSAKEIKTKLEKMEAYTPSAEDFEDRLQEVESMMQVTIGQLNMMLEQAKQLEEMQAQQAAAVQPEPIQEPVNPEPENVKVDFEPAPKTASLRSQVEPKTIVESTPEAVSQVAQMSEEDAAMYTDCIADAPSNPVVDAAMQEVCSETKQQKAAQVICELMQGELSLEQAVEIVGLIDAGLVPNLKFEA